MPHLNWTMNRDRIHELRQGVERAQRAQRAQQQSREHRKRAEELVAQAERLISKIEQAQQRRIDRNANSGPEKPYKRDPSVSTRIQP